ncbi:uncharacterized protein N7458_002738 [Penicillium daleae]|uniref:Uncharacterized protein n=1 Tax=Penicillium daleae TaxID=63821 RepID=A0AAD6CE64_9EURO|nr:uncharacterized protein N7458_002738 [Penicillium daleae]KAJ5461186.1 hypothetical protein N7458_002738 [Penicillium daleae]
MDATEILRIIVSQEARTAHVERSVVEYKQELARTRHTLEKTTKDLEETARVAELLYELSQKLGTVTDYLVKQQRLLDNKDRISYETIFNILLKQAESQEDEPKVEGDSISDKQGGLEHPAGVIALS